MNNQLAVLPPGMFAPLYQQNQQNFQDNSPLAGHSPPVYPQRTTAEPVGVMGLNFFQNIPTQGVGQTPLYNIPVALQLQLLAQQQVILTLGVQLELQRQYSSSLETYQRLFDAVQQQQEQRPSARVETLISTPQGQAQQVAARQRVRPRERIRRGEGEREEVCWHHARGICKFGSWCKFSHPNIFRQVKSSSQEHAPRSYVQAEQENRTQQNLNDDDAENSSLTRAPITLEPITRGRRVERFLSSIEADKEVYTGGDVGFPSAIGTLPYIIKVVPKDHPGVQNLFFVPYYDLKRPNEEPYISLENLGQVERIPGQSPSYQARKMRSRPADIKLGGVHIDLPPDVIVGLIQFLTGIPIKAIDVFKKGGSGSSSLGLCTIWINYDEIDYSALNLSGDEANLEETVKWAVISAFTDNTVWMASITEANGVFIARDDGSKAYLCNLLNDRRRHGLEQTHCPRHPMTAARWQTTEERRALQREEPHTPATSATGGGAAATSAVAGGGAAASPVGGRSAPGKK